MTFEDCHSIRFGGPNDEALHGHPLSDRGLQPYRAHVVHNSPWLAEAEQINSVHEAHRAERFALLQHFVLTFQDEMFEALASRLDAERVVDTFGNRLASTVRHLTVIE